MGSVFFNSTAGRIEAYYNHSEEKYSPVVLLLHSHPLHGGNMNSPIIESLFECFVRNGFSTMKMNFRGVGKSEGSFGNGTGELIDAAIALDWLQETNDINAHYWVVGVSFGACVAVELTMRRPEISRFIVISPPVNKCDLSFFSPCPVDGAVFCGELDSVVPLESVLNFVEKANRNKNKRITFRKMEDADHFFRNKLDELAGWIEEYIKDNRSAILSDTMSAFSAKNDDEDEGESVDDLFDEDEDYSVHEK